jgi:hypothetical protein
MRLILAALFVLATGSVRVGAQGGPPLITDDPGTVARRHWEINLAFTAEHSPGLRQYEMPLIDMNYGYSERVQLKWEIPWVLLDQPGMTFAGAGNSNLGIKWRFKDEDRYGPAMSTYPQVLINNPTSSVRRGVAERGASLFLPIQVQSDLRAIHLNVDAGYLFHGGGPDAWSWGIAIGREFSPKVELLAEIHGESERGEQQVIVNVGSRCRLAEGRTLLFSIGRSIPPLGNAGNLLLAYIGVQLGF